MVPQSCRLLSADSTLWITGSEGGRFSHTSRAQDRSRFHDLAGRGSQPEPLGPRQDGANLPK
eukprot:4496895-Alexandrium_andersonii.AAC.1